MPPTLKFLPLPLPWYETPVGLPERHLAVTETLNFGLILDICLKLTFMFNLKVETAQVWNQMDSCVPAVCLTSSSGSNEKQIEGEVTRPTYFDNWVGSTPDSPLILYIYALILYNAYNYL